MNCKWMCVCVFVSVFSMAVPFVQDWDLVQTLGEGAYGEYDSSSIFTIYNYFHTHKFPASTLNHMIPSF